MRRQTLLLLSAWLAGTVTTNAQDTPLQILQRFIGAPATRIHAAPPVTPPLPRLRPASDHPAGAIASATDRPPLPSPRPVAPTAGPSPSPAPVLSASTCLRALAYLGVRATPVPEIAEGECTVVEPVAVAALGGGEVLLSPQAVVACDLATTLATWLRDLVQPIAEDVLGDPVTGVHVAAGYVCRSRNNLADGEISEHAFGKAIDISAISVGGRWIEVGAPADADDAAFLSEVRRSACGPFTTVLGPGSDAYHTDHFHFDLAVRNTAGPSRGLYCR